MKIVHLCLGAFYPDNYSYQENMLPKFHKSLGYEVEVIASQESFDKDGNTCYVSKVGYYQNEYDIKVCRLQYSWPKKVNHKLKHYKGVYEALSTSAPDIIFIHNCQFTSIFAVIKYIKQNPKLIVYVDNHVDFSNSARNWLSKNILHKILWKMCAQSINPFVKKFYGVLPARVDFLVNIYGLPKEKVELLVMGVDDEQVERVVAEKTRADIRKKYNIAENDFLVMTGGKIDGFKKQTLLLMEAIKRIDNPKVKLLVFGSVTPDLKEQVNALCDGDKVQYIGWIPSVKSYDYFSTADIAVFPGRHSVFWEQVAGMGIPLVCKYWDGTTHVERDGNVRFLYEDSTDEIYQVINTLANSAEQFDNMKKAAEKVKTYFSYNDIAKRAIGS